MAYKIFSEAQVAEFIDVGFVKLEEAIPRQTALEAQDWLWGKLAEKGALKDDPTTWTEPMIHLKELYDEPVFRACMTDRLKDAIEDLVGPGRWAEREAHTGWGWWPVNFAVGADRPWNVDRGGWHWDGSGFRHSVTCPDQGLLLLPHFSEVGPQGGGTLVASGSQEVVARFLARQTEALELRDAIVGCNQQHPWLSELTGGAVGDPDTSRIDRFMHQTTVDDAGTPLRVVETQASPGDVVFCHPFLYHSASPNHSGLPRFMCNRTTPLKAPMQLERANGDYSPVEQSIRQGLGLTPRLVRN